MILRKAKTASGATVVQIFERKNRRDVVFEHLGSGHSLAELAALMSGGRGKINAGQGALDLRPSQGPQSAPVYSTRSRQFLETLRAACTVARYMQDKDGFSIRMIVRPIRALRDVNIALIGRQMTAKTELTDDARHVLDPLKH